MWFSYRNDSPCGIYKVEAIPWLYRSSFWECGWLKIFCVAKGQLISKGLFDVIRFDQKTNEIFLRLFALASRKRLDQKYKALYILIRGYLT